MVAKKRKSKRQTLKQKYKIVKRTKEHHRKLKKGAVLHTSTKKKTENHIPNAWPYKEDLLKEISAAKDRMEEVRVEQKQKRQEEIKKKRAKNNSSNEMDIVKPTEKAAKVFDIAAAMALKPTIIEDQDAAEEYEYGSKNLGQNSRRAYLKELRKVVERSDVILQVLDARDPNGTKSSAVEEMVLSNHRKKLVYVLNKCDLVPKDVLIGWLANLRQYHPAVPFKCNTQSQKDHLSSSMGKISKQQESSLKTNHAVGAEELIGLLKNYSRIGDTKSIITVGIVGFPNVGKSSLINSLMRTRAVGVSAMPGFTKVSQEVILDKNIRLIDSPGIVFADGDSAATILRNCVNVEAMEDVITPTQAILDRCPQAYLMQVYSIPTFKENDCVAFLALVAKAMGKLKKGGIPNIDAAARCVLHDWNNGKIKYFCKPPKIVNKNSELEEKELKIITEFSKELDIFDLKDEAIRIIDDIHVSNDGSKSNDNDVSYVQMDFDDV